MKNDGIGSANISALHCIDLSSPDIHTSVSLLKQVPPSLSLSYIYTSGKNSVLYMGPLFIHKFILLSRFN